MPFFKRKPKRSQEEKSKSEKPSLIFVKSDDETGFTSGIMGSHRECNPSAIVRELIQNSLDAKPSGKAQVDFVLDKISPNEIPDIENYKTAFEKAVAHRKGNNGGQLSSQESMIVKSIRESLKKDEHDVLIIRDNGFGLNEERMNALLSDGSSVKSGSASGAFGNGHWTIFPASALRYVFYGAIYENENQRKSIASGHAVLASHKDDSDEKDFFRGRSANGYYVAEYSSASRVYPEGDRIPHFISGILDEIKNGETGTAVIVPAFNHFKNEKQKLRDTITRAAVCSFFAAIHEEKLEIRFIDKSKNEEVCVARSNLRKVILGHAGQKRNRHFLSGQKAAAAYECLKKGKCCKVSVLKGFVRIFLLTKGVERTRVNLCRNGMWITNSDKGGLPGFQNAFGDRESFEALILIDAEISGRFHELVRDAESPLHNQIDMKSLTGNDAKDLRDAFGKIKKWLMEKVKKVDANAFTPLDVLAIEGDDAGENKGKEAGMKYIGVLDPISEIHRDRKGDDGDNVNKPPGGGGGNQNRNQNRNRVLHCESIFILLPCRRIGVF